MLHSATWKLVAGCLQNATGTMPLVAVWQPMMIFSRCPSKVSVPSLSHALPALGVSYVGLRVLWLAAPTQSLACWDKIGPSPWLTSWKPHGQAGMRSVPGASYLLHVVARLRTGLNEHDTQFFGALFPLLDGYLPGDEARGKISSAEKQPLVDMVGVA